MTQNLRKTINLKSEAKNRKLKKIRVRNGKRKRNIEMNKPHDSTQAFAGDSVPTLRLMNSYAFVGCSAMSMSMSMSSTHLSRFDFTLVPDIATLEISPFILTSFAILCENSFIPLQLVQVIKWLGLNMYPCHLNFLHECFTKTKIKIRSNYKDELYI